MTTRPTLRRTLYMYAALTYMHTSNAANIHRHISTLLCTVVTTAMQPTS